VVPTPWPNSGPITLANDRQVLRAGKAYGMAHYPRCGPFRQLALSLNVSDSASDALRLWEIPYGLARFGHALLRNLDQLFLCRCSGGDGQSGAEHTRDNCCRS
jgi:hypothetical protein